VVILTLILVWNAIVPNFFPFFLTHPSPSIYPATNGKNIVILGNERFLLSMKDALYKYGIESKIGLHKIGGKIHRLWINKEGTYKLFAYTSKYFSIIQPLKRKWDRIASNFFIESSL